MKTTVIFFYAFHNVTYFSFFWQLQILYARMAWLPDLATYLKVRYVWLLRSLHGPTIELLRGLRSGGGGGGVSDVACRKRKIASGTNIILKKFLHCCKREKKMLPSYFVIQGGLKNLSKTGTTLPLLPFKLWIWWHCRIIMLHTSNVLQ